MLRIKTEFAIRVPSFGNKLARDAEQAALGRVDRKFSSPLSLSLISSDLMNFFPIKRRPLWRQSALQMKTQNPDMSEEPTELVEVFHHHHHSLFIHVALCSKV